MNSCEVFGMGLDLATILAIYPAVVDGDLLSFSIGGPDPRVSNTLGLLGQPQGLSGSHNKFEGDSSPSRGDLYLTGNSHDLDMQQFQALYDAGKEKDVYDMQLLTDRRYAARKESIANNPYFFNAPFSGIVGEYRLSKTYLIVAHHVQPMLLPGVSSTGSWRTRPRSIPKVSSTATF